ncbi:MAG: hypothetical protein ACOY4T_11770 [Pseudomonadota bacterium]
MILLADHFAAPSPLALADHASGSVTLAVGDGTMIVTMAAAAANPTFDSTQLTFDITYHTFDEAA